MSTSCYSPTPPSTSSEGMTRPSWHPPQSHLLRFGTWTGSWAGTPIDPNSSQVIRTLGTSDRSDRKNHQPFDIHACNTVGGAKEKMVKRNRKLDLLDLATTFTLNLESGRPEYCFFLTHPSRHLAMRRKVASEKSCLLSFPHDPSTSNKRLLGV